MGVVTKALIKGYVNSIQLVHDIAENYRKDDDLGEFKLTFTHDKNFIWINFYQKFPENWKEMTFIEKSDWRKSNQKRSMAVFMNGSASSDYEKITTEPFTYLSLGYWGDSVEIMESLLKKYGGWIMRDDSIYDWEIFENIS